MKPWSYDMAGCETSHGLPSVLKANGHQLAHLCERNEKNAKLIAAAPELLAACKMLANVNEFDLTMLHKAIRACERAVARATK